MPGMTRDTNAAELLIEGLEQGHRYALIISKAPSTMLLKFRHAGDSTWYDWPGFVGTNTGLLSYEFMCATPFMKLVVETPPVPATVWHMSCIGAATANF